MWTYCKKAPYILFFFLSSLSHFVTFRPSKHSPPFFFLFHISLATLVNIPNHGSCPGHCRSLFVFLYCQLHLYLNKPYLIPFNKKHRQVLASQPTYHHHNPATTSA
ncbi:MAG: hypothetical protein BYD32DRAFT_145521 [Podila humilis]|nr:MAG: hypothetical protein BYD32DRAFT_145521 [Podila humilis]